MKLTPIQILTLFLTTSAATAQCVLSDPINQDFEGPGIFVPQPINDLDCWTGSPGCTVQTGSCGAGARWAEVDASAGAELMSRPMPDAQRSAFDISFDADVSGDAFGYFLVNCGVGFNPLVTIKFDPTPAPGTVEVLNTISPPVTLIPCGRIRVLADRGGEVIITYNGNEIDRYDWDPALCPEAVSITYYGKWLGKKGGVILNVDNIVSNPPAVGASYCNPAVANSTGLPASITAGGSQYAVNNNLTLRMQPLANGAFGYFITSQMQGFVMNPGGSSGNLCLSGAIGRYVGPGQIQNTQNTDFLTLDLDLTMTPQPTGFVSVMAGETWNFQGWYRDTSPMGPTTNFTDGLEMMFL